MKSRVFLASMLLGAIGIFALTAGAQQSTGEAEDTKKIKDELTAREQVLARQFAEFEQSMLKLIQRLGRSSSEDDKKRAVALQKALEYSKKEGVILQFEQLVEHLKKSKGTGLVEAEIAMKRAQDLHLVIQEIRRLINEDPNALNRREQIASLKDIAKRIEALIREQQMVQMVTELKKETKEKLKAAQDKVTDKTGNLIKDMEAKGVGGEAKKGPGEAKPGGANKDKGEAKDQGKGAEGKGNAKDAGKGDGKQGEAKGGEGKSGKEGQGEAKGGQKGGEAKDGQAKEGKGGEGKAGEAKSGDPKGGEGKSGEAKGGDPKGGEGKAGEAKAGDPKGGDPKAGDPKGAGEAKAGGGDPKGGEAKSGKGGEGKAGEGKDGGKDGGKGGEGKPGEAKGGEGGKGGGEAKGGGDPKEGGGGGGGKAKEGKQGGDDKSDTAQAKKKVQDAEGYEKSAGDNIAKENNDDAANDQEKAVEKLKQAKKKLEDLLNQLREEELERLLAALQGRCEKMLRMQIAVYNGTEGLYKLIEANDNKPTRDNQQASLKLSDQEKDIVLEATKAIEMLEAEGSAVAFPEVFQQVREDMKHVQRRLEITDVGIVTQAIEKDIIDSLKEMVDALKKAKQDLDNKKNPPPGDPKDGKPPPNADQKLLDQIAELKMIRSLQMRVNTRTETYGKMYVPKEGEQTADPAIRRELQNLSERQVRIFDVTNRIAKGDNK